jgi:hypothetical protein
VTDSRRPLRYRQVHLDFHTGAQIPAVGEQFDRRQFQEMLRIGHVDGVTLFSKCHHGFSYHPTSVGIRHPYLSPGLDLLGEQIEACHEIGVAPVLYVSAGFDVAMLQVHPEWVVRDRKGGTGDPLWPGYRPLCFNTPYLDYLCAQTEEACRMFGDRTNGVFLDIIAPRRCYCPQCLVGMTERGLDPARESDVDVFAHAVLQNYYERATAACQSRFPHLRVFHNSGHVGKGDPMPLGFNTHLELESLPTGGWGYDHFPVSAKYASTTGKDYLGMTGKFHTTWGEFGGFKRPEALRYECSAMLAFGAKCSVGDQLHPSGVMNPDTYRLIGAAYSEVAVKEPWCVDARPVSDVALVSPEAVQAHRAPDGSSGWSGGSLKHNNAEEGASRMLLEMHIPFDVIDPLSDKSDLFAYKVLLLPDNVTLLGADDPLTVRLREYLAGGGRVLLSGQSGMNPDATSFLLDLGLRVLGRGTSDPDYLAASDLSPTPPVRGPFVIHGGSWQVQAETGTQHATLAHCVPSYFNRAWNHFCSHQHTPDDIRAHTEDAPAAVIAGEHFVYFAHNIFTAYRQYGQPLYRDLVRDALRHLLPEPTVRAAGLPTAGRISLMRQDADNRWVLHLLYATPVKRGADTSVYASGQQMVEVIEDLVPLHGIDCRVRLPKGERTRRVTLEPQGIALPFDDEAGSLRFTVPQVLCHQMVSIALAGGPA